MNFVGGWDPDATGRTGVVAENGQSETMACVLQVGSNDIDWKWNH